ncbi:putative rpp14 family domain-containing protein [Neospora caninum Liverpool]|uniref:Ribonuclease P/MRP protein subunit POP5 n=1 Tax=Neospora caninum (strain Liverpool) TaxID=572307 RepID=F0V997_NEOCL|nr:putative rpp14 family domain-containing protein [Neospora caninum Liverpool]CBZ50322.1 putative rpp14 family domain-containing protein [Neospora caninum Liverpool]CEL64928.1 TPA: rpp14 family domain-containing protein, putative [Neospora caninum Liverpool]|eukprot:XP_003880356.1 putative rpp14 family domain-containing protein [Neospora caninum Liverpool]
MVRQKSRWVLGSVVWADDVDKTRRVCLTPSNLQEALRAAVAECWGALGTAYLASSLRVAHVGQGGEPCPLFVLQVDRAYCQELLAVLKAIRELGDRRCRVCVVHVGGTLRSGRREVEERIKSLFLAQLAQMQEGACSI